jgi:glycosyl hydrolase group 75 (putative chitosanase)
MRRTPIAVLVGLASAAALAAGLAQATAAPQPVRHAQAGPSADDLRDRVAGCEEQVSNGLYAEREGMTRDIPICATGNAVHWKSGMTVDCDGQPTDECNEDTDPAYQPETAFNQSDGEPLIAAQLPYVVVPTPTDSIWDYRDSGIRGGTVVAIVYEDSVVYGVVGDVGPSGQIGESSYATAASSGIDPDPATGGVSGKVVDYIAFPGVVANPIEDNGQAVSLGEQAAAELVSG